MTPTLNKASYWNAAGPAIALAVERKYYFKKLIKLCYSVPDDEVFYLLSLEICRWLDRGDSLEEFISWIECSPAGTAGQKSIILDRMLPGSSMRFAHGMVELGAMLGDICERYGEERDTPGWRLMRMLLCKEEITSSSTILYNGYPKGFVFHCVLYLNDSLNVICKSQFNLETFYSIYKEICYGEPAQLAEKASVMLAPAAGQLHASNADGNLIDNCIKAEGHLPAVVAAPTTVDFERDMPTKLTRRNIALIHIYRGGHFDEIMATKAGLENGHNSPTSGRQIMNIYRKLKGEPNNRTGVEDPISVNSMRKAIARVIPLLSDSAKQQAETELQALAMKI